MKHEHKWCDNLADLFYLSIFIYNICYGEFQFPPKRKQERLRQ